MKDPIFQTPKFSSHEKGGFGPTLKKRVNEYFKANNKDKTGDYRVWMKVIILPLLYIVPFTLMLVFNLSQNLFLFYGLWIIMGLGISGCGLGVMHDACHGSLSKSKKINDLIGQGMLNFISGSAVNWKIQHNVLHHTFTNVDGYDEDISPSGVMRFSPAQPLKPFFRFQAYYAWFFYGLITLIWATIKDIDQTVRFNKMGLLKMQGRSYGKEITYLVLRKIAYYAVFLVLPIITLDIAWYHIILGWLSMHFLAGLILGTIFQCAHVIEAAEFPSVNSDNTVENDVATHQLLTSANFANNNRILSWFVGGLNFQIEHHLFPHISHIHLKPISKIVKQTAEEFGLPYHSIPTFREALIEHAKFLNALGK